jgi:outer membrane protein TolC
MFFVPGRLPVICVFATSVFLAVAANAQQYMPLTLAEAEDLALESEPGQAALMARADALAEQSVVAGQLPDPTLRVGLNNYPLEAGGFSTEGMTHALVGLRQAFPAGKTRSISTRKFESLADEMTESADARGRDVLTAVRQAWLEAYYWQQAHALVSESRPFFDDLAVVTRSLYAVGRKNQQDVLRSELELSRLDDRLIEIDRQRSRAQAVLGEWVGDDARRPIALKLPAWDTIPSREVLVDGMPAHPALRAADSTIAARKAGVDLAQEKFKPGWALDLGYSYREGYLPNGDPRSDFISLSVTVDLPFFGRKNRQDRSLAAALSERRAAVSSREQLRRNLASRLDAEHSHWQELDRRLDLYAAQILPQTNDQAQAALAAYQRDSGDFADVMRGYIDDLNARLDHIRLQVDRAQSYAVLANLGGLPR